MAELLQFFIFPFMRMPKHACIMRDLGLSEVDYFDW